MNIEVLIRDVLSSSGQLLVDANTLPPDADLFEAGLSSLTTVSIMLALEDRLNIEIPDAALTRRTFSSIRAIQEAMLPLLPPDAFAASSAPLDPKRALA